MNINFLTGSLILRKNKTGIHLFHENIIKKFVENNLGNNLVVSVYGKKKDFAGEYENLPYYQYLKFSNKLTRLLSYLLPIELFFGNSDIYICDGMIPITLKKSFKIAIIHDLMVKIYPQNYNYLMTIYLNYYFWRARRADHIIVVSETTKMDVMKYLHIPEQKITIVYNGIEKSLQESAGKEETLKINIEKKYIFYIGDLRKNKNIISAIKGFELAAQKDDKLFFYIAGNKAHEYQNLKAYIATHKLTKKVMFLGYVSDREKYTLYKHAFAFIFISEYEGFGVPILEAMSSNTPVITSDCSSMKEIADQAAILVRPHNINNIADAIASLNDEVVRLTCISRGKVLVGKFTWDNSYKQFIELMENIKI